MEFIGEKTEAGVTRREFRLNVNGEPVPGCLWTPEGAVGSQPLIMLGHGGSQHKKVANIASAAATYARELGYASVAIDAPGHGDRVSREAAEKARAAALQAGRAAQEGRRPEGGERPKISRDPETVAKVVAEWKATLDAVQSLPEVGSDQKVGYWGVSMGTRFGVPFVAEEPRVACAIFGLFGVFPGLEDHRAAAEQIRIPLMFVYQWEDELMKREQGIALFDAFGSSEKTMHVNPGRHVEIPAHERDSWMAFWKRHLEAPRG